MTAPPTAALRVLVAEDDETLRDLSRRFVEKLGHRVSTVVDGTDAVQAALSGEYDVVLMDVHMPMLDGLPAARRIREAGEEIRQPTIIALTAAVTTVVQDECRAAGMDAFMTKPITLRELRRVLQDVRVPRIVGGAGHPVPTPSTRSGPDAPTGGDFPALAALPAAARTEVLDAFRRRSTDDVAALVDALAAGAQTPARFLAHRLHGASATVGASALAGLCAEIETGPFDGPAAGAGRDVADPGPWAADRIRALRTEFAAVVTRIEATRRGHAST